MRNSIRKTRKRLLPLLAASVLLTGGIGASLLFAGGTADAAPNAACAGPTAAGTACTFTGTLILTSGTMTLTAPPALGWAATISGADQLLVDPAPADQGYIVNDATGTAPGWHVTVSATPFVSGANTLGTATAVTPTFSTNGSTTLTDGAITTAAPGASCAGTSTCTLPTNNLAAGYPVTITTGQAATPTATPVDIYDTAAGTGLGTIVIGYDAATAANPVGWWLNVPSNTIQGTYTSTVSMELVAGP
jgi:hypothetical protein